MPSKANKPLLVCLSKKLLPSQVFYLTDKTRIVSEMIINLFHGLYQIDTMYLEPEFRGMGFAPAFWKTASGILKRTVISGDQLSPDAEKLWIGLEANPNLKIYDAELNKFYSINAVGTKADDGTEILHPKNSTSKLPNKPRFHFAFMNEGGEECSKELHAQLLEKPGFLKGKTKLEAILEGLPYPRVVIDPLLNE